MDPYLMESFFSVVTHILIVSGIIGMMISVVMIVFLAEGFMSRVIRVLSAVSGMFVYIGARAVGISIPELMLNGMEVAQFAIVGLSWVVLPSSTGVLVAWIITRQLHKGEDYASRIINMVLTFVIVMFSDIYVASYSYDHDSAFNKALLPNLSFILSLMIYIVLRYDAGGMRLNQRVK